ncbi:hypothetical protein GCM10017559_78990 [Streptosporangium longisporum]|uniref:Uncharacterized protein n=1 Tax=Streptosporangium longisporum TaxID=46187 RepID=A0ABP6LBZ8_9ACTN
MPARGTGLTAAGTVTAAGAVVRGTGTVAGAVVRRLGTAAGAVAREAAGAAGPVAAGPRKGLAAGVRTSKEKVRRMIAPMDGKPGG